ncbi:excinuclease ABC subunit UvrA [Basilea psittacipulmonis]|uniref:UvrABC system protein A n=1 Tax=Basilea psittacipulmonis DSM 24701 TaxID=1072685 RepID=A0A077DEK9_9BURK|nr:excinuclease ABC subunit UvrA [Basilea psittacipulmonis]AIL33169.1 excinuclease ABC subunit A [Basilea psittacipulmonis DSM 24701]
MSTYLGQIRLHGARQNNLKNLNVNFNTGEFTVITGVSGSGKSSLAIDTLYAEGQRKYVETFSPYARQFLDRMDKPDVDKIEGILPAIAINQTNPVKTSRSSVGTMTELNDYLKILFARSAKLYCQQCAHLVEKDNPQTIIQKLRDTFADSDPRLTVTFSKTVPKSFTETEILDYLQQQGYSRIHHSETINKEQKLFVIQDRFRLSKADPARLQEAFEVALKHGTVTVFSEDDQCLRFNADLCCANCDIHYHEPLPSTFSFNSPLGACDTCRGFGRTMSIDYGLVIPNEKLTLQEGAVKPFQTPTFKSCQTDLEKYAAKHHIRLDIPWEDLSQEEKDWVINGDPEWKNNKSWKTQWYGLARFFADLESASYKMHVRILLSKYRSYTICQDCKGSRLKPQANLWRLGDEVVTDLPKNWTHFMPVQATWSTETLKQLPGLNLFDLMQLPLDRLKAFFLHLSNSQHFDKAMELPLNEVNHRLQYLCDVGVGYLNLDRQSRTLSGGEVQRINLTTALGTSLTNTLFVLDEPSIGLHPHDTQKIIQVLKRLKNNGNTLVVIEHDPQIMVAADRLLEIGPGPGERGGEIVFDGTPEDLRQANTLTGEYLSGIKSVEAPRPQPVTPNTPKIILQGARANNLKNIEVSFPLQRLVCITGVSGSGKSTLIQDVLYPALLKKRGKPAEGQLEYDQILGDEQLADVILVDQSPIGKTARSNPASYVGAFDAIRKLFALAPLSVERGYTAGTFSFNSGNGRCPTCGGSGFEHIEMQFLADVYLRCPDCNGKRFKDEVCEVTLSHLGQSASIDEVLDMTVNEALDFFKGLQEVQRSLQPLVDVGLDYLKLGQAVPTLSAGEAQRLKLAGHLAQSSKTLHKKLAQKGSLFLFDEPTTGLHFDDISKLMKAFRKLLEAGHSLIIIEHNLDVIKAADWLIDLGPSGGENGGEIVVTGTPAEVALHPSSYTAQALREYQQSIVHPARDSMALSESSSPYQVAPKEVIQILNAQEHNLKHVNLTIPRNVFTVITGVSGSGKSTLAFDILFNEGQRRYLESLNAYARSMVQPAGKPDVDAIYGIPPTVAIEQRTSRGGRKSTVGTMTEIHHFLRLLYVKLGTQFCPHCQIPVSSQTPDQILEHIRRDFPNKVITLLAPLVIARKGYYTDLAQWAKSKQYPELRVDGKMVSVSSWPRLDRYKEHTIELPIKQFNTKTEKELSTLVHTALSHGNGQLSVLLGDQITHYSSKLSCTHCARSFPELDPRLFSWNSKHGWCPDCFGTGLKIKDFDAEQTGEESQWNDDETHYEPCPSCHGLRLNEVARHVYWKEKNITDLCQMSVEELFDYFDQLKLTKREKEIASEALKEVIGRLSFMKEVGLGYLGLDRSAPTLSGGEAQRIRLAAQLGSNLQGVCYVLDEPTIGLHPRDNRILLNALSKLERNGNTLVVVEHDEDTIRRADHIIDIGPGAGVRGGTVVAQGSYEEIIKQPESITGRYLAHPMVHPMQPKRPIEDKWLTIKNAHLHNLKHIDVRIPVGKLSVVTGVSGSGKSSLARDILLGNLTSLPAHTFHGCDTIEGWEHIDRVLEVDQTPIGKTPRSCPATYVGFWDDVRKQFANTYEAQINGWNASRFSFNTSNGRCPVCDGQGMRTVEMSFLPNIKVLCEACHGARFNPETLAIQLRDKTVGEVLQMEIDDAIPYFANHPKVLRPLQLLQDVGLGYLTLGQPSPTLSGGEAQRIKLVSELVKARIDEGIHQTGRASKRPHTLYVLDEPTVGLSMADVEKLIKVLHRLTDAGNTVVVIEHNLDVMAEADWIVDLGPEGGKDGGQLVAATTPEDLIKSYPHSHTANVLKTFLKH